MLRLAWYCIHCWSKFLSQAGFMHPQPGAKFVFWQEKHFFQPFHGLSILDTPCLEEPELSVEAEAGSFSCSFCFLSLLHSFQLLLSFHSFQVLGSCLPHNLSYLALPILPSFSTCIKCFCSAGSNPSSEVEFEERSNIFLANFAIRFFLFYRQTCFFLLQGNSHPAALQVFRIPAGPIWGVTPPRKHKHHASHRHRHRYCAPFQHCNQCKALQPHHG